MANCKYCGDEIKISFGKTRVFCTNDCREKFYHGNIKNAQLTKCDEIIHANKICNGADGNCNKCPYDGKANCTEKLAKDTLKLLVKLRDGKAPAKIISTNSEAVVEILKLRQLYSLKKQNYKQGTMLHQYWSGKEEAAREIMDLLRGDTK